MKQFNYCIQSPEGLHARPAGLLVKFAQNCSSKITLQVHGKSADVKHLFAVMGLGVSHNDQICFTVEGLQENTDCAKLKAFCSKNL